MLPNTKSLLACTGQYDVNALEIELLYVTLCHGLQGSIP